MWNVSVLRNYPKTLKRKAQSKLRKPLAFACAACFELLACVFASSAALLSVFSELTSLQTITDSL